MQNTPRIFINQNLEPGKIIPVDKNTVHYLRHVMRRGDCLVFNSGIEYNAVLADGDKNIIIGDKTEHIDPSNDLIFYFAPIKKIDEMLNMVTQLGVAKLQPVITERTVARHVNWERLQKIIIEASEQSGRNSIPSLLPPVQFKDVDFTDMVLADERAAHGKDFNATIKKCKKIFVGPEGGFSQHEFETMDMVGVKGISLGKTILRAEVAAVVAVSMVINK